MSETAESKSRVGSTLESLLREDDGYEEAKNQAVKSVLAHKLEHAMKAHKLSRVGMAARMNTSRSQLDRLLDPGNSQNSAPNNSWSSAEFWLRRQTTYDPVQARKGAAPNRRRAIQAAADGMKGFDDARAGSDAGASYLVRGPATIPTSRPPVTAGRVGSERVRRHPHRRARSAPQCGPCRGPRACRVRVPIEAGRSAPA